MNDVKLEVKTDIREKKSKGKSYLSSSDFLNIYNFAVILNGCWGDITEWKKAKEEDKVEEYIQNEDNKKKFTEDFDERSLEYKLSNINQAKSFARYMNEIGCFYTDGEVDFEMVERFSDEEVLKIGILEHQRWLQEHYDMGWTYGNRSDFERKHKNMIPEFNGFDVSSEASKANYERLGKAEQDKDTDPMDCMVTMLKMFDGLRIYRL